MKKVIIFIISNLVLVLFILGFIDISKVKQVMNEEEFIYSIDKISSNLKCVGSLNKREQDIICATSDGLIELDEKGNIQPSLASGVEVRDNELEYEFIIRDNVFWSNGDRIIAEDIVEFFRETLIEEDEENISALLNVYGAKDYRNGTGSFSETVGISTKDNKLKVRLNSPDDNFLEELSKPQYRLRKNVLLWENVSEQYSNLIYSGNYNIQSMNSEEIILKRNANSNNKLVDSMRIIQNEEVEQAMAAFEIGNRDIVINPPKSQLNRLDDEEKLITTDSKKGLYMAFNPNSDKINLEDRRYIYLLMIKALEEYQLKNSIYSELAECSYFREDKNDLGKLQNRKVLTNKSESELDVGGIKIVALENSQNRELCEYLVKWFRENSEIFLNYDLVDKTELEVLHQETYYNIVLLDEENNFDEKYSFYESIGGYLSEENKVLIEKSYEENDESILSIVEEKIFNQYSFLPLLFYNDNVAISSEIINISFDKNENIDFDKLEKQ